VKKIDEVIVGSQNREEIQASLDAPDPKS